MRSYYSIHDANHQECFTAETKGTSHVILDSQGIELAESKNRWREATKFARFVDFYQDGVVTSTLQWNPREYQECVLTTEGGRWSIIRQERNQYEVSGFGGERYAQIHRIAKLKEPRDFLDFIREATDRYRIEIEEEVSVLLVVLIALHINHMWTLERQHQRYLDNNRLANIEDKIRRRRKARNQ